MLNPADRHDAAANPITLSRENRENAASFSAFHDKAAVKNSRKLTNPNKAQAAVTGLGK